MPEAPAGAGYWTAGYGLWVIRLGLYLSTGYLEPSLINFLAESLQACAALLLLIGSLYFIGRTVPPSPQMAAIGLIVAWAAFTTFIIDDFLLRSIPLYGFSGAALIGAGVAMMRVRRRRRALPPPRSSPCRSSCGGCTSSTTPGSGRSSGSLPSASYSPNSLPCSRLSACC
jgi:hypothetical protein